MNRTYFSTSLFVILLILFILIGNSCNRAPSVIDQIVDKLPEIFPDYTNTCFPLNIAPPNFAIITKGAERYYVEIRDNTKLYYSKNSRSSAIIIPPSKWKALCDITEDKEFQINISIKKDGKWTQYKSIKNQISTNPIDPYMAYRLLYPGYELWNEMGIYQRELSSYDEKCVLHNDKFDKGCMNCHAFCKQNPDTMMLHLRGKNGGTLIKKGDQQYKIETKTAQFPNGAVYPSWHPNGRYIAFSSNEISQYYHSTGKKPIEVSDSKSDIFIFDTDNNSYISSASMASSDKLETFPTWNKAGDTLYFCSAEFKNKRTPLEQIRYDLYAIAFDPQTQALGDSILIINASKDKKSISFPRVSPCGEYLMYTTSDYGNFSIWHPESDLHLLNLKDNTIREMTEVNSNDVESYHSWSSSGNWFVFSSKRIDGLWAHPHISAFDKKTGLAQKPFLLPQKDPSFYKEFMSTFNIPEFAIKEIEL